VTSREYSQMFYKKQRYLEGRENLNLSDIDGARPINLK